MAWLLKAQLRRPCFPFRTTVKRRILQPAGRGHRAAFRPDAGSIPVACDGSNINPVAIALMRVKLPNGNYYIPGSGTSGTRQTLFSIPAKYREDQYIANGDWIMSSAITVCRYGS